MCRADGGVARLPRRGPIAHAEIGRAQIRSALDDAKLAAEIDRRRDAAGGGAATPGVLRPLPDIAGHVVETVAVRREAADRGCALESLAAEIERREDSAPVIGLRRRVAVLLIAPVEPRAVEAAARGEFPLRLRWQRMS